MGIVNIDVAIDARGLEQQVESLFDNDTMLKINQRLAERCDPYVPYKSGKLSSDVVVTPEGVTYTSEYASKQYYGTEFNHTLETHPLATAHWAEVMMENEGASFLEEVKDILVRRANELYG